MRDPKLILKAFIEYAGNTYKFHDVGNYEEILAHIEELEDCFMDLMAITGCEHDEKLLLQEKISEW